MMEEESTTKTERNREPILPQKRVTTASLSKSLKSFSRVKSSDRLVSESSENVKSKLFVFAEKEHEEKMKTEKMKQELIELKRVKIQLQIAQMQGLQVSLVSDTEFSK